MLPLRLALVLLCVSALTLAACGGDNPEDRAGPRPSTPTAPTTPPSTDERPSPTTPEAPVSVTGGETTLRLSPTVSSVLSAVGVEVGPVAPARQVDARTIALPIVPGRLTPGKASAEVRHRGGIAFTVAGRSLRATEPVLALQRGGLIAEINGKRVKLFDVQRAQPTTTAGALRYDDLEVRLGAAFAAQLEDRIGGNAIPDGLPLGSLRVDAELDG
jgi:hypothetical protein